MARIRTIKPEFPQSESMGRVSRESRLCFIMLWTIADDAGRLRGNSRMLASLLFPYDTDAPKLIERWMGELEAEGCIARYSASGNNYVEIANWLDHQKIDKPSQSKIPPFDEHSRTLANPREPSSEDLRTKDQGPEDQGSKEAAPAPREPKGSSHERAKPKRRLPEDWQPNEIHHACAAELGVDCDRAAGEFRNYWIGEGAVKADWDRTFTNRLGQLAERGVGRAGGQRSHGNRPASLLDAAHAVIAAGAPDE